MSYNILSITSILLATLVALATYPFRSICQNCARIDMTFGLAILALQGDSHRLRTLLRSTQNQKKHFSPPPMHVQMKCLILGISKPCRPCPPCVHPSKHLLESLTHLAEAMPNLGCKVQKRGLCDPAFLPYLQPYLSLPIYTHIWLFIHVLGCSSILSSSEFSCHSWLFIIR